MRFSDLSAGTRVGWTGEDSYGNPLEAAQEVTVKKAKLGNGCSDNNILVIQTDAGKVYTEKDDDISPRSLYRLPNPVPDKEVTQNAE
jgi:hypothetical protein